MNDVRTQVMPFSTDAVWAMLPAAFENMRETLATIPTDRLAAAAAMPSTEDADKSTPVRGGVAVIPFSGVVSKRRTLMGRIFGGQVSTLEFRSALAAAEADPAVESILALFDSPGGTVDGTADAADAFAACKKPTVAYCEDLCASAAYWVASQAKRVVCNSTATVGSIGVFAAVPDFSRMAKNAGVDVHLVRSAAGKGAGTPGTPVTEGQLAEMQKHVNAIATEFTAAVSRGRGKDMSALADGSVCVGKAAVECGLVDAVETLAETLAAMQCCPDCCPGGCGADCACTDCADTSCCKPAAAEPADINAVAAAATQEEPVMADETPTPTPTPIDHTADIAAMRAELAGMKHAAAVAQGVADRKLTPALVKAAAAMPYDTLVAWIAELPVSAPDGGSVTEQAPEAAAPALARHPSDFVGASLASYKKDTASAHQSAIAYMDRSEKAGHPVNYRDALIAVTRK